MNSLNISIIIITIAIFLNIKIFAQDENKVKVVDHVDLNKYTGLWYEIAKIPNSFQDHCAYGTTAYYELRDNDKIKVINKCYEEDGEIDEAEGVARIVDTLTNAKLEVSFVSFLGFNFFWGDYWIIGLDENYQWAIVGHPDRKYGWILSRSPELNDEIQQLIFNKLAKNGYNQNDFVFTSQKKNLETE